jgi:N-acetylglucosaminyldiphosphoundecaprenol N-acetyl-beta-D-mannosaminyltransferase
LNLHHFTFSEPPPADQINLFGMQISRTSLVDAAATVLGWCAEPRCESCRFVVTPNVDHAVLFQSNPELQVAYSEASLVLADGAPLVLASRMFGRHLPERVAGSDLVPQILRSASSPLRVFLLGAEPGVAERAAESIEQQWPGAKVVGTYSPPIGFETMAGENERIFAAIEAAAADLLVVGLGAPRQEIWAYRHRKALPAKVAICAGATIDFLAGHRRRSPVWMRRLGLEWFHRVCAEPRRLARRYARDAWVFPQLLWREWRRSCV